MVPTTLQPNSTTLSIAIALGSFHLAVDGRFFQIVDISPNTSRKLADFFAQAFGERIPHGRLLINPHDACTAQFIG